jgi:HlyD family secretion protein
VVTYDTIIAVANPELKLKPGMTANVSIIVARREGALKIPKA